EGLVLADRDGVGLFIAAGADVERRAGALLGHGLRHRGVEATAGADDAALAPLTIDVTDFGRRRTERAAADDPADAVLTDLPLATGGVAIAALLEGVTRLTRTGVARTVRAAPVRTVFSRAHALPAAFIAGQVAGAGAAGAGVAAAVRTARFATAVRGTALTE